MTSTIDIPLHETVGATGEPQTSRWTSDDTLLYALGLGAGTGDLKFTTENSAGIAQRALPTWPVVVGQRAKVFHLAGRLDWSKIVHGEQSVELFGEVPVHGEVLTTGRVAEVWDKGKAAQVVFEFSSVDADSGTEVFRTRMGLFVRGAGGWGGDPGPKRSVELPDRSPDHVVTVTTRPEQALLYRLSGDRNRLHSDPAFASKAGFDRPILHGLCTYGIAGRALLAAVCGEDPSRFKRMDGRFSAPVFPGDELRTEIWADEHGASFVTRGRDGQAVLANGRLELNG
jgi:acyl dehydratase